MKTKILLSVLAIGLSIALIGGATMAWFTDEDEVPAAEFTAGTVLVDADGPNENMEAKEFENVNPGDCIVVTWDIINKGTKDAEFRVKLDEDWISDINENGKLFKKLQADLRKDDIRINNIGELNALLDTDNVYYAPVEGSDWKMYSTGGEIWLYYTGGPVPGTFDEDNEANRTVELKLIIAFDGELTDNKYMGAEFTLGGTVEAVQASNDAPSEVWDLNWEEVKTGDFAQGYLAEKYLDYIKDTDCWDEDDGDE